MIPVFSVEQIRAAESRAFEALPEGELMARAVRGLARICREVLVERRGKLYGSRLVILVGAGNNGADAMWTGAHLANRGVQVTAATVTDNIDQPSSDALRAAGGRLVRAEESLDSFALLVGQADIVLDGLLGIGGRGALREPAASWSQVLVDSPAEVIAVDIPSGVDSDSGKVADHRAVILADRTVCLGTVKGGLVWGAGPEFAGDITFHDIDLYRYFEADDYDAPLGELVDFDDALAVVGQPSREDNKYTRGVVGVVTGSDAYPGAAVLSTGGALRGGVGMVRYAGGAAQAVIQHWPEAVIAPEVDPKSKTNAWVVGSGGGEDQSAVDRLERVLSAPVPVVLDADGLTLLARSDSLKSRVRERRDNGLVTVLTPHDGEFARLGFAAPDDDGVARVEVLKQAADNLGAVILLKGATTIVATPSGAVYINDEASSALATAGSGDVLAGLLGSMLAHFDAQATQHHRTTTADDAARIAACAALIHGLAGTEASAMNSSVVAADILEAIPTVLADRDVLGRPSADPTPVDRAPAGMQEIDDNSLEVPL